MLELRDYQRAALDGLNAAFLAGMRNPILVMPTGSGKSPTLATFIRETLEQWDDTRIVMIVHVRELVAQNLKTLLRIWPEAPVSVYSAGLKSRDLSGQVVFASIQSIYKKAYDLQKVDLVLVDEAHLIPPSGDGMYRRFMDDLARINGGPVPMVGFTATPYRMASGSLVEGEGRVFDGIAYEVEILKLIDEGYLVPPITKATDTRIDTSRVGTRGGEFIAGQLQAAADRAEITEAACDEIVAAGKDRRSWLVFSTGVQHAFHIRDALRRRGVSCETVTGETPLGERDRIIRAYQSGELRCLTNDSVLTVGFDAPQTDLLAVLRPTQSPGLYVQMVGRGLRTAPGKTDCIVLDMGGNAFRHGPLDQIKGRPKHGGGVPPMKECPDCRSIIPAGCLTCPDCGHEWEIPRERKQHAATADAVPLLSTQISDWLPVTRVEYREHRKPGKPPSLRVDCWSGFARYSEWVCLEHEGYARKKAEAWWRQRTDPSEPVPSDVADALLIAEDGGLREPEAIRVRPDGQYHRIVAARFG